MKAHIQMMTLSKLFTQKYQIITDRLDRQVFLAGHRSRLAHEKYNKKNIPKGHKPQLNKCTEVRPKSYYNSSFPEKKFLEDNRGRGA